MKFLEQDNLQMKHHINDLEQSLKINKGIIDCLLQTSDDQSIM